MNLFNFCVSLKMVLRCIFMPVHLFSLMNLVGESSFAPLHCLVWYFICLEETGAKTHSSSCIFYLPQHPAKLTVRRPTSNISKTQCWRWACGLLRQCNYFIFFSSVPPQSFLWFHFYSQYVQINHTLNWTWEANEGFSYVNSQWCWRQK